jgi:hypothetical protein
MQLYNLDDDPIEMNDLSRVDGGQGKLAELQSLLAAERARYDDPLVQ